MSDTVKLIIAISKHQHEICKQALKDFGGRPITECEFAIAVGTPLDDVKAEIKELRDSWEKDCYHDEAEALNTALKIIDKHIGKAESESKAAGIKGKSCTGATQGRERQ